MRRRCAYPPISLARFQSTHSLRSATSELVALNKSDTISIHALLAECDQDRNATQETTKISIHALLAECDQSRLSAINADAHFNPRTPCGVRPASSSIDRPLTSFQSTHSLRSATSDFFSRDPRISISIHALLAECDPSAFASKI